jgi:hypothetical protein
MPDSHRRPDITVIPPVPGGPRPVRPAGRQVNAVNQRNVPTNHTETARQCTALRRFTALATASPHHPAPTTPRLHHRARPRPAVPHLPGPTYRNSCPAPTYRNRRSLNRRLAGRLGADRACHQSRRSCHHFCTHFARICPICPCAKWRQAGQEWRQAPGGDVTGCDAGGGRGSGRRAPAEPHPG